MTYTFAIRSWDYFRQSYDEKCLKKEHASVKKKCVDQDTIYAAGVPGGGWGGVGLVGWGWPAPDPAARCVIMP